MQDQVPQKINKQIKLPQIPNKRYFTIGEASELCAVKPHVLRYWEQEFPQLSPCKRRGNRRYYQYKDVTLIRQIRELLYDKGYTIVGARKHLSQHKKVDSKPSQLDRIIKELEDALNILSEEA